MSGTITVDAGTTRLKPGQTHLFRVQFHDLKPCVLRFELTDYDSGTITNEGKYTAPGREGSFEVRILCEGNLDIGTYAYVEVKR